MTSLFTASMTSHSTTSMTSLCTTSMMSSFTTNMTSLCTSSMTFPYTTSVATLCNTSMTSLYDKYDISLYRKYDFTSPCSILQHQNTSSIERKRLSEPSPLHILSSGTDILGSSCQKSFLKYKTEVIIIYNNSKEVDFYSASYENSRQILQ